MGKLLLFLVIIATSTVSLFRPWIGMAAYYVLALLGPQFIWWWNFQGLRVTFFIAAAALLGFSWAALRGRYDFSYLKTKLNLWVFLLWIFIDLSYFLGPYVSMFASKGLTPNYGFSMTNKIFLFYFCSTVAINSTKKLRYLGIVFSISTIYLIYWANYQYFTRDWSHFAFGRLMGPIDVYGGSIYADQNAFAMLFVTGLPFIYFLGLGISRKWLRYVLWSVIPLGWNAIFLTGSRGGLLGLGVIVMVSAFLSKRKTIAVLIVLLFLGFFLWQAGNTMKQRSETITNYQHESSAEGRIQAWKAGLKMIEAHPITGVGLDSFLTAFPHYSDKHPRVAHNTFIQFTAESGIGAGICYLMIIFYFYMRARKIDAWCKAERDNTDVRWTTHLNNSAVVSFAGLITCSLFLSLTTYEIFYFLLIFNNTLSVLRHKAQEQEENLPILDESVLIQSD
ncbi:MAG: O-antigen ligase family protein [Nitrospiraceae bacterium]|nr:O-antigen ligase family protein [Nitrospiraceae bacterium]